MAAPTSIKLEVFEPQLAPGLFQEAVLKFKTLTTIDADASYYYPKKLLATIGRVALVCIAFKTMAMTYGLSLILLAKCLYEWHKINHYETQTAQHKKIVSAANQEAYSIMSTMLNTGTNARLMNTTHCLTIQSLQRTLNEKNARIAALETRLGTDSPTF